MTDPKPALTMRVMFATPLAEITLPDAGPQLETLRALFLSRENELNRYPVQRPTQHGLFESRFDVFDWTDEPVQSLARFCHGALSSVVKSLNGYSPEDVASFGWRYESWFHITRKGGFQGLHQHQNASWSGIFCVDPGDAPADKLNYSGKVRFHDPRGHHTMHEDAANNSLQPPFSTGAFDYVHEPGKLILMPSYLQHEIFPYMGERPRIVVAFNAMAWRKA